MNNTELDHILKSARVPAPPEETCKTFPERVMAEIQRRERAGGQQARGFSRESVAASWLASLRVRPTMVAAVAMALVLAGGWIAYRARPAPIRADPQFTELQKCFREIEPLFPNQIKAIVFDQEGAELVLADEATVPASAPLYLKICGPNGCRRFVTFSGQQIPVNGELCDVLLDRQGNILVVGRQFVWSSSSPAEKSSQYQIEARSLGTT